jgi:hypothetical protein
VAVLNTLVGDEETFDSSDDVFHGNGIAAVNSVGRLVFAAHRGEARGVGWAAQIPNSLSLERDPFGSSERLGELMHVLRSNTYLERLNIGNLDVRDGSL